MSNTKPPPPQQSALSAAASRLSSLASHLSPTASTHPHPYTSFDALPPVPTQPQGCTWGIWGSSDELGTLNLLTPDRVRAARSEIQTGESIQLDWPLHNVQFPGFGRKPFEQKVLDLAPLGFKALDDEVYVNTQSGSQWDSLKHVRFLPTIESEHLRLGTGGEKRKTRKLTRGAKYSSHTKNQACTTTASPTKPPSKRPRTASTNGANAAASSAAAC